MSIAPEPVVPATEESATSRESGGVRVHTDPRSCPSPHGLGNKIWRVVWGTVWLSLFRPSPRVCYAWRRWLLRRFGAKVGTGAKVLPSVRIWAPWNLRLGRFACLGDGVDCYCVGPISIGDNATVSQRAFLCAATHDVCDPTMSLVMRPIRIEQSAWVGAEAFVGPGVVVGEGAVVGARAVTVKDIPAWMIVAGNPARILRRRELRDVSGGFLEEKQKSRIDSSPPPKST